jgi:hypothetical protein
VRVERGIAVTFVEQYLSGNKGLIRRVFEDGGVRFRGESGSGLCPFHDDQNPSFSANLEDSRWLCHGCSEKGDLVTFVERVYGVSTREAIAHLRAEAGVPLHLERPPRFPAVTRYRIRDAGGVEVAVHVREDAADWSKTFRWERDGSVGLRGIKTADLPLYGSELLQGRPDEAVVITEGEKAADALRGFGFLALGTVTGASVTPSPASLLVLEGRSVILWPDLDAPGLKHMNRIGDALHATARTVRFVSWGEHEGDDAADFVARGGTADEAKLLLAGASESPQEPSPVSPAPTSGRAVTVLVSDVEPETVEWLWEGRIPFGKITVVDGDPGLGKSLLTLDIAARLSSGGTLPDGGKCEPAGVVILSCEDGLGDTIRPRLEAAGADLSRIAALVAVKSPSGTQLLPTLEENVLQIAEAIESVAARLVIIDPLMAYLGRDVNSYRDQDVRAVLAPVAEMADRTGVAVVVVRHLRKSREGGAIIAGGGSIGIIGAARSGLMVARHPDDDDTRVLVPVKSNLAAPAKALSYRITVDPDGRPMIEWDHDPVDVTADQLVAFAETSFEGRTALEEAMEFLEYELASGLKPTTEVNREAKKAGISEPTLRRARARLGVKPRRDGYSGTWSLELPASKARMMSKALTSGVERLDAPVSALDAGPSAPSQEAFGVCEAFKTSGTSPGGATTVPQVCAYFCGPTSDPCETCKRPFSKHASSGRAK